MYHGRRRNVLAIESVTCYMITGLQLYLWLEYMLLRVSRIQLPVPKDHQVMLKLLSLPSLSQQQSQQGLCYQMVYMLNCQCRQSDYNEVFVVCNKSGLGDVLASIIGRQLCSLSASINIEWLYLREVSAVKICENWKE